MKTTCKVVVFIALIVVGVVGWNIWRNNRQAGGTVNKSLLENAERLVERLRAVQKSTQTNTETRK